MLLTMRPNKQKWQDDGPVAICRLLDPAARRNDDNCFIDRHLPVEWGEEAARRFVWKETSSRWCHQQSSIRLFCLNKRLVAPPWLLDSSAAV